ncbi:hypothetical protein C7212DRAFT_347527 [Tuber magnatum]|uniref:Uncharacterized protein n=1 Tax=Tuber magnatum TaxID=42249 RepID=A0A317SGZ9_9PEZI|nr:hypothetical protein C7212DRAFT_347527 [Tuber magnatum]
MADDVEVVREQSKGSNSWGVETGGNKKSVTGVDKQGLEEDFGSSKNNAGRCNVGRSEDEKGGMGVGKESGEMVIWIGKKKGEWETGGRGEREDGGTGGSI